MTKILHRRGSASQWTSANTVLDASEIGYESDTGLFKIGDGSTAWNSLEYFSSGGGATGGGEDEVFYENGQTITTDYTITTNKNAMSAGPVGIEATATVTIPSGSVWSVV
jgi:hypothetical protein